MMMVSREVVHYAARELNGWSYGHRGQPSEPQLDFSALLGSRRKRNNPLICLRKTRLTKLAQRAASVARVPRMSPSGYVSVETDA